MNSRTPSTLPALAGRRLDELRASAPLVQAITNTVVSTVTANSLLALGASPAMVDAPGEAGAFAPIADALLINLGTPQENTVAAMHEAAESAGRAGTPWVLDPVAVGALPLRTTAAGLLVAARPTVVRGNASEIIAVAGAGSGGRGTDSTATVADAEDAARELAVRTGGVVAVSGAVDLITDGTRTARVHNGHILLTRVTGGGCVLGAVMAAFTAGGGDPFEAVIAATVVYGLAAERAAALAPRPGSFSVALLDSLDAVTAGLVEQKAIIR
ncbi:hydroxyethylthiazole kinase [Mycetocola reblochoni]|uniref:Hydroxyethylthiazole kinase n=2 Tax=Mycetocola reblochoni TaxID=331618 RepID=A0A1R4JNJ7_9MICO|nr:hydroxyethylthiazole kinase [Mycetocola reblochoni]RLP68611.1 hydroxyethylthiazole kinase [Mycetocola reblochoni]SJN33534.1 Hydroxyethylthiazole kinase [Mycetocola reblochoni REB411]